MPVEKESRVTQWIAALREWAPTLRPRLREWIAQAREDPIRVWRTDAVRYTVYVCGAIVLVFVVAALIESSLPAEASKPAQTAHFDVLCTDPACRHHFAIERTFKFDDFPVVCPKCGKTTGRRAVRATTGPARGQWVVRPDP